MMGVDVKYEHHSGGVWGILRPELCIVATNTLGKSSRSQQR